MKARAKIPSIMTATGFTLVEALVGVLVFSMMAIAISSMLGAAFTNQSFTAGEIDAVREARKAMPQITDEIRYGTDFAYSEDNTVLDYNKHLNSQDYSALTGCRIYRSEEDGKIYLRQGSQITPLTTVTVDQIIFTDVDVMHAKRTIKVEIDVNGRVLSTTIRAVNNTSLTQ